MIKGLSLSLVLLSIILIFFAIDFWFLKQYDRERETGKGWSWDYTLFITVMSLIVALQPYFAPWLGWTTKFVWGLLVQIIGIVLVFCSFLIHIWARRHLQRFYTERVELQQDHRVINSGPYGIVRHPIITTFFGLAIGVFLINPALPTIAIVFYTFWDFLGAAKQEEELLSRNLPDYPAYMKTTPRFLPRIKGKQ